MSEQSIAYEEVPGSRTTQQAIDQSQRERIAYEELQPGTEVQAGDQYRNTQGRWVEYSMDTSGVPIVGPTAMARRPHKIAALQDERDELKTALRESHAAHAFTTKQGLAACKDRDEACRERDLARSEVARLSTELWARKPLEDRVASLTEELAQAREASQQSLKTITDNADTFVDQVTVVERERDEARAERDELQTALIESRLWQQRKVAEVMEVCRERDEVEAELKRVQEVVRNLYNEPTARQVQDMLRTWATELDWSAGCFDSVAREQIDTIQKTLVAVIERIEGLVNPEGVTDGE